MANPIDDDTLQRLYDGDLSPLEEHGVHARLEADPEAQQRLARLGRLTEVMRDAADQLGSSIDSARLYAAIESQLEKPDKIGLGVRLRVITSEWMEHRRATLAPVAAAAAVAAITLAAVVRPNQELSLASGEAIPIVHGSRVENVDFGSSTGTVFEIDNGGVAAAVVWITDEGEAQAEQPHQEAP